MAEQTPFDPPGEPSMSGALAPRRERIRTDIPFKDAKRELVEPFEREYVAALLTRFHSNLSAASRASGLSRKHLRHLMRKYGIGTERVLTFQSA